MFKDGEWLCSSSSFSCNATMQVLLILSMKQERVELYAIPFANVIIVNFIPKKKKVFKSLVKIIILWKKIV